MKKQDPKKMSSEDKDLIDKSNEVILDLFGFEQAPNASPLFLKNRTLTISCLNSTIAQEINLRQEEIVNKINDKLGKKEVDRIRYLL